MTDAVSARLAALEQQLRDWIGLDRGDLVDALAACLPEVRQLESERRDDWYRKKAALEEGEDVTVSSEMPRVDPSANVPKSGPNAVLDQTDADNYYITEENHKLQATVRRLEQERLATERVAKNATALLCQLEAKLGTAEGDVRRLRQDLEHAPWKASYMAMRDERDAVSADVLRLRQERDAIALAFRGWFGFLESHGFHEAVQGYTALIAPSKGVMPSDAEERSTDRDCTTDGSRPKHSRSASHDGASAIAGVTHPEPTRGEK